MGETDQGGKLGLVLMSRAMLSKSLIQFSVDGRLYRASLIARLVKNLPANAGDMGLIPELEGSPGAGNGNPLQFLAWRTPWRGEEA